MKDTRDRFDRWIDAALPSYAGIEPRRGLETRVLRYVRGERAASGFAWPRWAWVVPAMLACFVAGVLAGPELRGISASLGGPSPLAHWCEWLQTTWLSVSLRESLVMWWYVEGAHLLGLAVMLGPSMMLDLRLVGVLWKRDPVSRVEARFLPLTIAGFSVVMTTGLLLFVSEPVKCYESPYFRVKMALILLAGLNALLFHATIDRRRAEWDRVLPPPPAARWAGILGLALWTAVIFAGRYMAYSFN